MSYQQGRQLYLAAVHVAAALLIATHLRAAWHHWQEAQRW